MPLGFLKKILQKAVSLARPVIPSDESIEPQPKPSLERRPVAAQRHQPQKKQLDAKSAPARRPTGKQPVIKPSGVPNEFYGLALAPAILSELDKLGFTTPTPIQAKTIPLVSEGQDVLGIAQTGTGKTLAFGLPLLQKLTSNGGKGLVLAPTRELALQIDEALHPFARALNIKSAVLIGGAAMGPQISALRKQPRLVVATPGRLIDFMEQKEIRLNDVAVLVLDEADRMLDMGFAPQILKILKFVPKERQTLLFSATMPPEITALAASYMKLPIRTEVAPSGTAAANVTQELYVITRENKMALLEKLLKQYTGSVLLFTRTKRGAARVAGILRKRGLPATEIHSDRSMSQRTQALDGFKSGQYRILVATDIAARGIDVTGIELVVNFDLPEDPENYVHRIGRTGRAGMSGHAISIACPDQGREVADIERLMKVSIAIASHPEIQAETLLKSSERTINDLLYGPPKGKRTGRERAVLTVEQRPEHKRQWGR